MEQSKGQFNSNFGFLMAALGSAVGLGNLWGFPYKMGLGGGFAFLLLYLILLVVVGYPLILSEIAIGRKSQKAAIEAYDDIHHAFKFNGVLQTVVPFFLIAFYCTFGGYVMKYFFKSLGMFAGNKFDPGATFGETLVNTSSVIWVLIFLALTVLIVLGGVSGGIEKFCKVAMPALFVMLVIIVIRSVTLPGAGEGLAFLFKPHFEGMSSASGFFETMKLAGSQMFFSLSLASGCLIAYGSYLDKGENLEKDAVIIAVGDTCAALLAGLAIMPACTAYGLDPGAGPALLFISMPTVFNDILLCTSSSQNKYFLHFCPLCLSMFFSLIEYLGNRFVSLMLTIRYFPITPTENSNKPFINNTINTSVVQPETLTCPEM